MKKLTFAAAASIAALATAPAFAADLGRPIAKAPAMVAAPVYSSWTGFYIGGQVGYQYGYFRERDFLLGAGTPFAETTFNPDGVVGGGHIGFNFQTGPVVFGVEGDIEGSGVRGGFRGPGGGFFAGEGTDFNQRWQASIRGRLGFTAGNTVMLYATGGAAFSDFRYALFAPGFATRTCDVDRTGYTVGAGIEWMFAPSWTARVEYRYSDFGTFDLPITVGNLAGRARQYVEFSTVRVGISYKFGGGSAPVVAAD